MMPLAAVDSAHARYLARSGGGRPRRGPAPSPVQRMRDALELSEALRALALSRLRSLHPDDSPIALVERLTGESLLPAARTGPPRAP
jgi:hypothetical protein